MSSNADSFGHIFQHSSSGEDAAPRASTTAGGRGEQEPEVVWEAANLLEAQIVKGRLESEGIPAVIRGEALGQIYGLTTGNLAATDGLVPGPLADQARAILATDVEWNEEDWDDVEDADSAQEEA